MHSSLFATAIAVFATINALATPLALPDTEIVQLRRHQPYDFITCDRKCNPHGGCPGDQTRYHGVSGSNTRRETPGSACMILKAGFTELDFQVCDRKNSCTAHDGLACYDGANGDRSRGIPLTEYVKIS